MLINSRVYLYLLLAFNVIQCNHKRKHSQWLKHLNQYARRTSTTSQMILITDDDEVNHLQSYNNLIQVLKRNTPSIGISFRQAREETFLNSIKDRIIQNHRVTALFIVITLLKDSNNTRHMLEPINFLLTTPSSKPRPRCLFVFFSEKQRSVFEKLLWDLWSNRFLDVTVLEIIEKNIKMKNALLVNEQSFAALHQLNPFTNEYTRKFHSPNFQWFPDKLQNLHGYKMKVGLFNYPPTSYVERNSTGHPVKNKGSDVLFANTLSELMNFKIINVPSKEDSFGKFHCSNKNLTSGFNYQLMHHEIQFIAVNSLISSECEQDYVAFGITGYYALVPIIKVRALTLDGKWVFFSALPLSILVLTTIWVLARVLRFDIRYWHIVYVIQIVLQTSAPQLPQKFRERIVYVYILIVCMVYSSSIYAGLTAIGLNVEKELKVNNLNELHKLGFHTISYLNIKSLASNVEDKTVQNLIDESIEYDDAVVQCSKYIVKGKNYICIFRRNIAEMLLQKMKNKDGEPLVKLVEESLWQCADGVIMEPNSPYSQRFSNISTRLMQFGFRAKWSKDTLDQSSKIGDKHYFQEIEASGQKKLRNLLLGIILLGCISSLFLFIAEVIFAKLVMTSKTRKRE